MNLMDCRHHKISEIDGRLYCDFCDIEIEQPYPPICHCFIDLTEEQWICQKCGTVYSAEYLREVGWPV
ncbi:hypothetical protein SAMN02745220_05159 [Desulfopila aestuarii DSM 18488]|uniref:Uncharacterized protein n=1 Tax=Desulfopila aestuarii DSM 18488 TaxID=1121416 RepID=A0A1M7YLI0_9BACT|nr:hypothetical protein SAMN02745220_05159 [Desulfopila aestuarii DSM 18488]